MGRWAPDAQGRLAAAAIELFVERGFERTTVAEIAARAGLTERTFFRYFADKREVLFAGGAALQAVLAEAVACAPADATPMEAVAAGLEAAGGLLEERRAFAKLRQTVVAANAELRERELIKLAALATALAEALRHRGVADPSATLAGEAGVAAFRVAFERWCADDAAAPLPDVIQATLSELRAVATS